MTPMDAQRPDRDDASIDVAAIRAEIRAEIRTRAIHTQAPPDPDPEPDLAVLHTTTDVLHVELRSHRRFFGPVVLVVKRILIRLLTPSLERQELHNAATTRLVTQLCRRLERAERQLADLDEQRQGDASGGEPPASRA